MSTPSRQFYMGPRPFERASRVLFCGRKYEANELASLVIAHATVLLYAQSGTGKTSLLNAGLVPLLEAEDFEVLPAVRVRGELPEGLAASCNVYMFNVLSSLGASAQPATGAPPALTLADYLRARPALPDTEGQPRPRALIFDQFEELFTFYPERVADRRAFFEQVRDALKAEPLLRVIFAIREEFLAELSPYESILPDQLRTRVRLERLREAAALEAVTGPLTGSGISFAPGVAENLVADLLQANASDGKVFCGDYVEPVQLQVVCDELCRRLPPNVNSITQQHVRQFGNINDALARFYWDCLWQTQLTTGVSTRRLRNWFSGVLITPEKTRDAVRFGKTKTGGLPNRAVTKLEEQHLIRGEERSGRGRWYELTHDRFIAPILTSNETAGRRTRRIWTTLIASVVGGLMLTGLIAYQLHFQRIQHVARLVSTFAEGARLHDEGKYLEAISHYAEIPKLAASETSPALAATNAYYVARAGSNIFECHMDRAITCIYESRDFTTASNEIAIASATRPLSSRPLALLGNLEMERIRLSGSNDYQSAKKHYGEATNCEPDRSEGYLGLAEACLAEGHTDAARTNFNAALKRAEGDVIPRCFLGKGRICLDEGDYDQALVYGAHTLGIYRLNTTKVRPEDEIMAHAITGNAYFYKGRYSNSYSQADQRREIAQKNALTNELSTACCDMAECSLRRNRWSEATDAVTALDKLASTNNDFYICFIPGIIKARTNRAAARACWEKGLAGEAGQDTSARMRRVAYQVALGKPGTAAAMSTILTDTNIPLGWLDTARNDIETLKLCFINRTDSEIILELLDAAIAKKHRPGGDAP